MRRSLPFSLARRSPPWTARPSTERRLSSAAGGPASAATRARRRGRGRRGIGGVGRRGSGAGVGRLGRRAARGGERGGGGNRRRIGGSLGARGGRARRRSTAIAGSDREQAYNNDGNAHGARSCQSFAYLDEIMWRLAMPACAGANDRGAAASAPSPASASVRSAGQRRPREAAIRASVARRIRCGGSAGGSVVHARGVSWRGCGRAWGRACALRLRLRPAPAPGGGRAPAAAAAPLPLRSALPLRPALPLGASLALRPALRLGPTLPLRLRCGPGIGLEAGEPGDGEEREALLDEALDVARGTRAPRCRRTRARCPTRRRAPCGRCGARRSRGRSGGRS